VGDADLRVDTPLGSVDATSIEAFALPAGTLDDEEARRNGTWWRVTMTVPVCIFDLAFATDGMAQICPH